MTNQISNNTSSVEKRSLHQVGPYDQFQQFQQQPTLQGQYVPQEYVTQEPYSVGPGYVVGAQVGQQEPYSVGPGYDQGQDTVVQQQQQVIQGAPLGQTYVNWNQGYDQPVQEMIVRQPQYPQVQPVQQKHLSPMPQAPLMGYNQYQNVNQSAPLMQSRARRVRILDNNVNVSNSLKSDLNILLNQHGSNVSDEEIYHLLSKMFIKEKIDTTKTDFAKNFLEISFKDFQNTLKADLEKIFLNFLNENNINTKIFDSNERNNNSLLVKNHNGIIGFLKSII